MKRSLHHECVQGVAQTTPSSVTTTTIVCLNLATTAGTVADSGPMVVNYHQPFSHAQETNEFLGTFGGSSSSSSAVVGNHFSSLPESHGYYGVGFSDLVGNPLMNQSIGEHVDNYNSYRVNQEDPNNQNQSFNDIMNMNHNASTSGNRGYPGTDHMIINNKDRNKCEFRSSYHLDKYGP
ncbi:hypothetical protein Bca52824_094455 [Brassica carinata]|uniref:Uncharacterized protein n=1 Tax=Brassica carinata TaxID=52824 RepID=A0A8X7P3A5_BRACI|nr:hypothetical protein Bca52824_094455 [Brassica carinata]